MKMAFSVGFIYKVYATVFRACSLPRYCRNRKKWNSAGRDKRIATMVFAC